MSGMTAALEAAKAGYHVVLVEKEAELGGWARKVARTFPSTPPYRDLEATDLESTVRQIEQDRRIEVYRARWSRASAASPDSSTCR